MSLLRQSTLVALIASFLGAVVLTGCNTMRGVGRDVERAGEKIQQNAK